MSDRVKEISNAKHPEDRKHETEAIDAAHTVIDAFFEQNREKFLDLALTYKDDKAEYKLQLLREKFWGEVVP